MLSIVHDLPYPDSLIISYLCLFDTYCLHCCCLYLSLLRLLFSSEDNLYLHASLLYILHGNNELLQVVMLKLRSWQQRKVSDLVSAVNARVMTLSFRSLVLFGILEREHLADEGVSPKPQFSLRGAVGYFYSYCYFRPAARRSYPLR